MKRRTFKKLVALLRAALEQNYCKNSVLAVSQSLKLICSTSRAYKIRLCILQVLQQMDRFSLWQTGIYSSKHCSSLFKICEYYC